MENAAFVDPFEGVEIEETQDAPAPPAESAKTPNGQHAATSSKKVAFSPVSTPAPAASAPDVQPIPIDEIFSYGASEFERLAKGEGSQDTGEGTAPGKITKKAGETMSPEMINISASIYVGLLETVVEMACEWWSGITGNYKFPAKLKEQYEKISALYIEQQNIQLTPGHFFALLTVALLANSGVRAHKDRQGRIKAEQFRKKAESAVSKNAPGKQVSMFEDETPGESTGIGARKYFSFEKHSDGKLYYNKSLSGSYAKKTDREAVPPELVHFLPEFFLKNNRYPTQREVLAYLHN